VTSLTGREPARALRSSLAAELTQFAKLPALSCVGCARHPAGAAYARQVSRGARRVGVPVAEQLLDEASTTAEAIGLEDRYLHPVPDQIPPDEAGLLQVLGTVVHSQQPVPVSSDTVAVVIGLGVSGMLHTQLLSDRGAGLVIGVSRSPWKLELAKGLGADLVATPDEASDVVARASSGRGADLVIESVGKEETVVQSIDLAMPGGDVIIYGTVTGGGTEMPYYQLYFKELTLHNPRAALPRDYDEGIRLAAEGRIRLAPLVTGRYPLEEAGAAFAAARSGDHLKVLLTP